MKRLSMLLAVVATSCGGGNPATDPAAYCGFLAGRLCDELISCKQVASSHRAECVASVQLSTCSVRPNESARGLFKINADLSKKCLADLAATGCTRDLNALGAACRAAIEPAAAAGGKCEDDSHCRELSNRCIGSSCDRTCQAAGALDQPCRPTSAGTGTCDATLFCDPTGKCIKGGATGADCSGSPPCDANNFCDVTTRLCVALPTTGQTCRAAFPQCAEASYCNLGMCAARLGVGTACLATAQCVTGANCRGGTCQALAGDGATCATTNDCAAGLSCDTVTLTCLAPARAFYGESCSSTRSCAGGLACRNLALAKPPTAGTSGTCGIPAAGDSCFSVAQCPPGSTCVAAANPQDPGTCTASASGATCTADRDCLEAEACHAVDRKCVGRAAAGESCVNVACVANTSCVRRGTGRICVEPSPLNGACNSDMVQTTPCQLPLLCARTECVSAGRRGEPCLGTSTCFYGSCHEGLCGDPRPEGATCTTDPDCSTGACDKGLCVAVCMG